MVSSSAPAVSEQFPSLLRSVQSSNAEVDEEVMQLIGEVEEGKHESIAAAPSKPLASVTITDSQAFISGLEHCSDPTGMWIASNERGRPAMWRPDEGVVNQDSTILPAPKLWSEQLPPNQELKGILRRE